jgi:hypothetical protein
MFAFFVAGPALEQAAVDAELVQRLVDRLVDDVVQRLGPVVEGARRRSR